ncbi:MAG: CBS domain-containing protein, partial [Candidatus Thiodiazotropha taylori]|nr:CBS domain-containing protein [Candidatus Thiodiazotropha taylori]
MLVSDYMSSSPVTVQQEDNYDLAFEIMEEKNMHHLPVVDEGNQVVGIVTRRDLQLAARYFKEAPVEISEVM